MNQIALAYCAPFQNRAKSTVEDAFQDIMQELSRDDHGSKHMCVLHRNVIAYFISRLLNVTLTKVTKTFIIPHCSVLVIKQNNLLTKTIPMHVNYIID